MIQIRWKKVLAAFAIIFLLSRSRKIIEFVSNLNMGDILTVEPLRDSSPEARYLVTLALFALFFVTVFRLLQKRK